MKTQPAFIDFFFQNDYALSFLNENVVTRKPFFMMIAPPAAHAPFIPAERHRDKFKNLKALRNEAFNRTSLDVSIQKKLLSTSSARHYRLLSIQLTLFLETLVGQFETK